VIAVGTQDVVAGQPQQRRNPLYRKFARKMGGYLHRYDGRRPARRSASAEAARRLTSCVPTAITPTRCMRHVAGASWRSYGPRYRVRRRKALECPDRSGRGFLAATELLGGPVPISLGVGFRDQVSRDGQRVRLVFGDGAMNQAGAMRRSHGGPLQAADPLHPGEQP